MTDTIFYPTTLEGNEYSTVKLPINLTSYNAQGKKVLNVSPKGNFLDLTVQGEIIRRDK